MGTTGDKIVLLDGVGGGESSATSGLLSMIPGLFANLMGGGTKMDPNLVAALMNGRNNQDAWGGGGLLLVVMDYSSFLAVARKWIW